MQGKTIKLYIMGADYKNLKSAELSNWVGKAYIGERKHIPVIQKIEELQNAGIYFLMTKDEETDRTLLYIGETDNIAQRIKDHQSKDYWEIFVAFISKDSNLTKAHVRYLEKKLCEIAKSNLTTIDFKNGTSSPGSKLPDSDKSDMSIFQENMIFVLDNLGIVDFTKKTTEEEKKDISCKDIFYLNLKKNRVDINGNPLQARLIITEAGYRLLKGSYIDKEQQPSLKKHCLSAYKLREKLEKMGCFDSTEYDYALITNQDIDFKSPTGASDTVRNASTNGRTSWKLLDNKTLDDFESKDFI